MSRELVDLELLRGNVIATHDRLSVAPSDGIVRPWVTVTLDHNVAGSSTFTQYGHPFEFRSDEADTRGGGGSAPSPLRYLLSSIGFCAQGWCAKTWSLRGIQLEALTIHVRSLLDMRGEHLVESVDPHPQWFVVDVRAQSSADPSTAIELANEALRRCPVTALMARAVPVYLVLEHNGALAYDGRPEALRTEHEQELTR